MKQEMTPHLLVLLVAATLSYLITMILRRVCDKFGLLDFPDPRKIHRRPVPYLGGVAIYAATMIGIALALHLDPDFRFEFLSSFVGLFVAAAIVFLLGIFDDLGGSTAGVKLSFQTVAATVMWAYGFRIDEVTGPFGAAIEFDEVLSWILTTFWFVSIINAVNLIDGLDGLAAGIGAIAATTLAIAGLARSGDVVLPFLGVALTGALLGFLPHNLHPAKIFLGDTGAMTIGFLLAAFSLISYAKAAAITTLVVPVAALAVPVVDTLLAVVRRARRGAHLFRADREHLHHLLLRALPHARAVAVIHLLTLYFAAVGLGYVFFPDPRVGLTLTVLLVGSAFAVVFGITLYAARRGAKRVEWE